MYRVNKYRFLECSKQIDLFVNLIIIWFVDAPLLENDRNITEDGSVDLEIKDEDKDQRSN